MIRLVPYKAEHLLAIVDRDGWLYDAKAAMVKEHYPAFTGMVDDVIIVCAGVIIPQPGTGYAWAVFTKDADPFMFQATRIAYRALRDIKRAFNLHRMELLVHEGMPRYVEWAEFLGFRIEKDGLARKWTSNKQNVIRMEMVDGD